jgi:4-amino-4-deoxy-L-arabinose transferase-like glycosyltransferase
MLLFAWAVVTLGAFSLSRTQLPHYVLPVVPPLAILVGAYLAERSASPERNRLFALGLAVTTVMGAGALAILVWALWRWDTWRGPYVIIVAGIVGVLAMGTVAIVRSKWLSAVALLVVGAAALAAFIFKSDPLRVYEQFTTRHEARRILSNLRPGDRLISYPYTPYSLAWYLWPREMANPPNEDALAAEINRPVRTLCILHKKAVLPRLLPKIRWPTTLLTQPPNRAVVLSDPSSAPAVPSQE